MRRGIFPQLTARPIYETTVIGIIPKANERGVIEELFQLFKTPWELYRADGSYDVVLVSGEAPKEVAAPLMLVFGSDVRRSDREAGVVPVARRQNARLDWRGIQIPLYGQLLTFEAGGHPTLCTTTASEVAVVEFDAGNSRVIRLGYDLFDEIAFLLTAGQPVENAAIPTLDLHIGLLRDLIVESGISLIEIAPAPAGYDFAVCLTHDIDFVGIRRHKFDHTMCGFLYRATAGAALNFVQGKSSFSRLMQCWKAAATLPFVHLGLAKDFWMPFEWYLEVEKGLSPTYYFIPFKHRAGDRVMRTDAARRASAYDIGDIPEWITRLQAAGCEVGVHGIDAWNSVEKGRDELNRVAQFSGDKEMGIRIHWLMRDEKTCGILEQAGYSYDSTSGYNEVPGYLNGTTQVFRPPGAKTLLELPMHIQDGVLFFPGRLGLTDAEAAKQCDVFIANAKKLGGALTFIWHDRSHGPERFWGEFYAALVQKLKAGKTWFGQARQVVAWFRQRREVSFKRAGGGIKICGTGQRIVPPMKIRIQRADEIVELAWDGECDIEPMNTSCRTLAAEVCAAS